jgi:hypothetical protein
VTPTVGTLSFSAATSLTGFVKEGGPGLGVFRIGPSGEVTVEPFNVLSVQAKIENDGLLDTAVLAELAPDAGSATSDGDFVARADGTVSLRPGPGSTMTLSNAASVTGAGRLETSPLLAGAGTVHIDDGATFTPGSLAVFGASRLELETDAQVGRIQLSGNTVTGGRHGSGLLVVSGPAESLLSGGRLGQGTTRLDGPVKIEVGSDATRLSGGAQLRTNGASTWTVGGVELATGSDWENAGALSITTPASPPGQTAALSGPGVLRNLGAGSITKSTAQPFLGSGPLTNAGTITVAAGTFGSNPGGTFGTLTQTAGLTVVSGGATLDKTVLLQGGILRGKGTVRALVNSGGTVEPGSSPGTLTVSGDYAQSGGGTLKSEITGTTPDTQYDVLAVGGAASLDGTLAIATGGFVPALGDSVQILTAGSRSGQWATVSGSPGYDVEYGADGVMLAANPSATPTPTPTATPTATPAAGPGPGAPAAGGTAGATATSAPAAALKPADVIRFPSNRRCVSRRSFRIRLRTPKGAAVSSARVVVNGKRVAVVRGRRLVGAGQPPPAPARPLQGRDHGAARGRPHAARDAPLPHLRAQAPRLISRPAARRRPRPGRPRPPAPPARPRPARRCSRRTR